MNAVRVFALFVIAAVVCAAQVAQPDKKPPTKARPAQPGFVCPDSESAKACKSYEELIRANDKDLPMTGYICFQKQVDAFFVVYFDPPPFTLSKARQQLESGSRVKEYPASGYFTSYKDGVNDTRVMPSLFFSGNWFRVIDRWGFISNTVNFAEETRPGQMPIVAINGTQIAVTDYKYKSVLNNDVQYSLTIRRSTGRFSESMVKEGEQLPFFEDSGRCIRLGSDTVQ